MPRAGYRATAVCAIALLAGLVGCSPAPGPERVDVGYELDRGRALDRALVDLAASGPTSSDVAIATGYLERHRLGLGSPFRLMEYALEDPRLQPADRHRLAWSLLARTADGLGYRIDPAVLDDDPARAARHAALIEGAVQEVADPEVGELAVRLAYGLAAAEGSIPTRSRDRALAVAALVRDRVVSRRDAQRLIRAGEAGADPLTLLRDWRTEHAFEVERPVGVWPATEAERRAMALATRLLASIRAAGTAPLGGPRVPEPRSARTTLLGPTAAWRLATESARFDAPPQTPVLVYVRRYGRWTEPSGPTARFFTNAVNEERLAAEWAVLNHADTVRLPPRLAVLWSAVGLRAYAQERAWFPGTDGPAGTELEDRFGLSAVTFGADVPPEWRPYYLRMVESALTDLQRVLPFLDVRGLEVRVMPREGSQGALAVHDPHDRTVYLPAGTGAGTIAHEIAHDIDWQIALRRFRVRGDYGSDRAVRLADARLTPVLERLQSGTLEETERSGSTSKRPAEVFARSVDWFVTTALARDGRTNGYLSSFQDEALRGYGGVWPPDVTGQAGSSLITILDEVAPVHAGIRRWFLGSYGRARDATAWDLVRRVAEAPLGGVAPAEAGPAGLAMVGARMDALIAARDSALDLADGGCNALGYDRRVAEARRRLVLAAAEARATGIALDGAGAVAGPTGRAWLEATLQGRSLEPAPEPAVVEALEGLAERVRRVGEAPDFLARSHRLPGTACGAIPFASAAGGQTPGTLAPQMTLWSWSW